ncbi:PaaI family thioesterase [Nocardioides sp. zg-536]|uniref:Acyl-coenzyme A thioesterase THEM4 n=1 Tax=Nocardioides faecalis TaxID=2803858 RepID=A0A938Y8Q8_9ACTN|nr:PaaI family thioesterase [Nocardioides faecalis]MBM9459531.1 PaaI family thioesterase [Nocardioides faecalis]MBS4753689.1 PaaI family thioesterase [Nocardioides faecalis]QVI60686.1 PaaI family thioesterase [Nocardioides faecalis]
MEMFVHDETPTAAVDQREQVVSALAGSVRDLVDATIRSTVADEELLAVRAGVDALVARLRTEQRPGPAGVRYNSEGRSWSWGNAVVGHGNAIAPPLAIDHDTERGRSRAEVVLGAAYEGPPGMVHGGVSALLLDQIMGETASGFKRLTMTGTLTLRYRRPLPLGPVALECWIASEAGRKVTVEASIGNADGVAVEATGLFLVPRWAPLAADEQPEGWRRSAEG